MKLIKKILNAVKNFDQRNLFTAACIFSFIMVSVGLSGLKTVLTAPQSTPPGIEKTEVVDFTKFLSMVDSGALATVEFAATKLTAKGKEGGVYVVNHDRRFSDSSFPQELARKGVTVVFPDLNKRSAGDYVSTAFQIIIQVIFLGIFLGIGAFMVMNAKRFVTPGWPNVARNVKVRFADVAGQDESKFELEEIKTFLKNPEAYEKSGAKAPRGVLLVGPPGTGKTLLAEALAGETGVSFIYSVGSEFSNMFVGTGRDRIEKMFKKARKSAPCIIFIDEIDSLARARGGSTSDVGREQDTTLNQLLTEMNGFGKREGVIVIGATNRIDVLDAAVLRPGRFDRIVQIGLPDMADRVKILKVHVKGKKLSKDVDLGEVAKGTPGFSGAELENIVNEAATFAARARRDTLTAADFEDARDKVFMGAKRSTAAMDEFEKKITAVHEAGHALVATRREGADPVHQATIIPRTRSLGHVMQLPEKEWKALPKSRLLAKLDVLVAGRVAEEVVFGSEEVTTGAASDIEEATKIATNMVTAWGMSDRIGMRRVASTYRGLEDEAAYAEIDRFISDACGRVRKTLSEDRVALDRIADALFERETLSGREIREIAG